MNEASEAPEYEQKNNLKAAIFAKGLYSVSDRGVPNNLAKVVRSMVGTNHC